MASLNEKLAGSLEALRQLQGEDRHIFQSSEFTREDRERLQHAGFVRPVTRGWLMLSRPDSREHDTTPWFSSVWEFCACYCNHRFGDHWHLSAGGSLLQHAENTAVPKKIRVYASKGMNNNLALPFEALLQDVKATRFPDATELTMKNGLRVFKPEAALLLVPGAFYRHHPVEAATVLKNLPNVGVLLQLLLSEGRSRVAGRLAGAFRHTGMDTVADGIGRAMRGAGFSFRETDPFAASLPPASTASTMAEAHPRATAPGSKITHRIRGLWAQMRDPILTAFPLPPGLPESGVERRRYMKSVAKAYVDDAYNSLSIEGYQVTPELIERVRSGQWNPQQVSGDREQINALSAFGYWQAHQMVQKSIESVLEGGNAGRVVRNEHSLWYQQMFEPFAAAGQYGLESLAGYRNQAVYLRGSRHVPMRWERVGDAMNTLFELLEDEPEPAVRAAAGHLLFGYIHPYPDGNGRNARFLMNAMLASGGYPWTVIHKEDRQLYLEVMQQASVEQDFDQYAQFVGHRVQKTMERNKDAAAHKAAEEKADSKGQQRPA